MVVQRRVVSRPKKGNSGISHGIGDAEDRAKLLLRVVARDSAGEGNGVYGGASSSSTSRTGAVLVYVKPAGP